MKIILILVIILFVSACKVEHHGHPNLYEETDENHDSMNKELGEEHVHDDSHAHHEMEHESLMVENEVSVDLIVHEDPKSGWNLEIITTNFEFSPEMASLEHVEGKGHGHVYVNGNKVNRIYSNWYHISKLEQGENEIRVTLNANSHEDLMYGGKLVEAIETVVVE